MNNWKLAVSGFCLALPAGAQTFSYPGCADLSASQFQITELAQHNAETSAGQPALQEPVSMAFQGVYNAAGDSVTQVNMFFAERETGNLKFFNGATNTMSLAGHVGVESAQVSSVQGDNGFMGVAVDPNYNTNRYVYLWYSPTIANLNLNRRMRLSRFTVTAQNTLDMSSEKIMMDILESKTDQSHTGGPMEFDKYGDLWGTFGNNSNDVDNTAPQIGSTDSSKTAMWGPPNTASLRGGEWRIHPDSTNNKHSIPSDPTSIYGNGYSIPAGNFGEYWANQFQSQGNTTLAAQYRDTTKVLPEIYVKGDRSNFSLSVHPTKRWLAWGVVNYNSDADEFNLVTHPIFAGFPFWEANNRQLPWPSGYTNSLTAPTNTSPFNSGVTQLPPATGSVISCCSPIQNNVAIGGDIYAYDRNLKNPGKMPPHFDNHWFVGTFQGNKLWMVTLDTNNVVPASAPVELDGTGNLFSALSLRSPLAFKIGPDGAFYVLNYDGYYSTNNPAVEKISYTGTCKLAPVAVAPKPKLDPEIEFTITQNDVWIGEPGEHTFSLYNLDGERIFHLAARGATQYSFADLRSRFQLKAGLYLARIETPKGTLFRKISLL